MPNFRDHGPGPSAGGATLGASLTAAKRVTGRVVVYGAAGGEAPVTNWEPVSMSRDASDSESLRRWLMNALTTASCR